jgi:hypothetical protein
MRQTYMDHHLIFLSSLCMSVCMLSDDIKKRQAIITAVIICLECSCGYGYVCVRIVLTLPILRVPKSGRGLPICLSEPIWTWIFLHKQNSCFGVDGVLLNFSFRHQAELMWCDACLNDYIVSCQICAKVKTENTKLEVSEEMIDH